MLLYWKFGDFLLGFIVDNHRKMVYYETVIKGKPVERRGRKAKGLRSFDYDSRLPH